MLMNVQRITRKISTSIFYHLQRKREKESKRNVSVVMRKLSKKSKILKCLLKFPSKTRESHLLRIFS